MQFAKRHIGICGLPGFTIFIHIFSQMARFQKEIIECNFFSLQRLSETLFILSRTE